MTSKEFEGSYWNTRIVRKTESFIFNNIEEYETYYEIYEVYYDGNNKIIAWTKNPKSLWFSDYDDMKDLIRQIKDAAKRTVLYIEKDDNGDEELIDTKVKLKNIDNISSRFNKVEF